MDPNLFRNPPNAYRPAPFWSINDRLEADELQRQVREFARAGYGGWFFHARVGILTRYLSPEWMDAFGAALEEGKRHDMLCWIYDEDSYPSGFAAGLVLQENEAWRGRGLRMCEGEPPEGRTVLGRFAVRREGKRPASWRRLEPEEPPAPDESLVSFVEEPFVNSGWFNNRGYADMLNPDAVDAFLRITHEAYAARFGDEFGKSIPGVFTDEPHISPFCPGPAVAWTGDLDEQFREEHGYSLLERLPELFLDGPESGRVRTDYWVTVARRFRDACIAKMATWCRDHGLVLTGHCWEHEFPRVDHAGSFNFAETPMQWPGIDLLGGNCPKGRIPGKVQTQVGRITVVKAISGLAHQFERPRIMSETYGGGGWEMSFRDLREILDWECVLGVNYVVPHLSHYSLRGCRKRDYPPVFLDYAPWWAELRLMNDYTGRLCYALSCGRPQVDVAVLMPLSDAWQTPRHDGAALQGLERLGKLTDSLLKELAAAQWEFDLVDELNLAEKGRAEKDRLCVGRAEYTVLILPPVRSLYSGALERIESFVRGGGRLLCVAPGPETVDGAPSARLEALLSASGVEWVRPERADLTRALAGSVERTLVAESADGADPLPIYVQTRVLEDGDRVVFWVNTADRGARVRFRGPAAVRGEVWDLASGEVLELPCELRNGRTEWEEDVAPGQSRLVRFVARETGARPAKTARILRENPVRTVFLPDSWEIELLTENALLLDKFACEIQGGPSLAADRIWRILKAVREHFGMTNEPELRHNRAARFYDIWNPPRTFGPIRLSTSVMLCESPEDLGPVCFVVESGERFTLRVNGREASGPEGFWLERSFSKFDVTDLLRRGENRVELETVFAEDSELEACYLVGRFGVWRNGGPGPVRRGRTRGRPLAAQRGIAAYGRRPRAVGERRGCGASAVAAVRNAARGPVGGENRRGTRVHYRPEERARALALESRLERVSNDRAAPLDDRVRPVARGVAPGPGRPARRTSAGAPAVIRNAVPASPRLAGRDSTCERSDQSG